MSKSLPPGVQEKLWGQKVTIPYFHINICGAIFTYFIGNLETCREYAFLRGYAKISTILHRGERWRKFEKSKKSTGDHQSWRLFSPLERLQMPHVELSNSKLDLFSLRKTSKTLAAVFNLFEIFIIDFSMGALCSESTLTSWVLPCL